MPTIDIPADGAQWLDTGATVAVGGSLTASCVGTYSWAPGFVNGSGDPPAVATAAGAVEANFPADWGRVNPYGVALLLLPVGQSPAAGQYTTDVFGWPLTPVYGEVGEGGPLGEGGEGDLIDTVVLNLTSLDITAGTSQPGPWRVWAVVNDDIPANNTGGPLVLTVTTTAPAVQPLAQGPCNGAELAFGPDAPSFGNASALWRIVRGGVEVDSGNTFDGPGRNGWVLQYPPPSEDMGSVFVAAPEGAPLGSGYRLLIDLITEIPAADFEVIAGTCAPAGPAPLSGEPRFPFSTGVLFGYRELAGAPAIARQEVGAAAPAPVRPLAGAWGPGLPGLDLPGADATDPAAGGSDRWCLVVDLGVAQRVGAVHVRAVALSGGGAAGAQTLRCYHSAAPLDTAAGGAAFASASALSVAAETPLTPERTGAEGGAYAIFRPDAARTVEGGAVLARYLYLVPSGCTGCSLAGVEVRGEPVAFGAVQDATFAVPFRRAEVRASAWTNLFPEAAGHTDGQVLVTARYAEFSLPALGLLCGATLAETGAEAVLTAALSGAAMPFDVELDGREITRSGEEKRLRLHAYGMRAAGYRLAVTRNEFGAQDFTAEASTQGGGPARTPGAPVLIILKER